MLRFITQSGHNRSLQHLCGRVGLSPGMCYSPCEVFFSCKNLSVI